MTEAVSIGVEVAALGRAPTNAELCGWVDQVISHGWGRRARSVTQVARAIVEWMSQRPCDFERAGARRLAELAGISPTTVSSVLRLLREHGYLNRDARGAPSYGRAATYSLRWRGSAVPEYAGAPLPAYWLQLRSLWTGDCYGGNAYRVARALVAAGPAGTTAQQIAYEADLARPTVRRFLRGFHDDGFADAPPQRRLVRVNDLSDAEVDALASAAMAKRHTQSKRENRLARHDLDRARNRAWFHAFFERELHLRGRD